MNETMIALGFTLYVCAVAVAVFALFWRIDANKCPKCGKTSQKHGTVPATGYCVCVRCGNRWNPEI